MNVPARSAGGALAYNFVYLLSLLGVLERGRIGKLFEPSPKLRNS